VEAELRAIMEENAAALAELLADWAAGEADFLDELRDTAARLDVELAELLRESGWGQEMG